jgi:Na+(H+)/acetate symporter ActP
MDSGQALANRGSWLYLVRKGIAIAIIASATAGLAVVVAIAVKFDIKNTYRLKRRPLSKASQPSFSRQISPPVIFLPLQSRTQW